MSEWAGQRIKAAEQRTETAERQLARLKVAHAKGLSPENAARLRGDDEEELATDADALLADLGALGAEAHRRRPADLDGGVRSSAPSSGGSFLMRAIRERP